MIPKDPLPKSVEFNVQPNQPPASKSPPPNVPHNPDAHLGQIDEALNVTGNVQKDPKSHYLNHGQLTSLFKDATKNIPSKDTLNIPSSQKPGGSKPVKVNPRTEYKELPPFELLEKRSRAATKINKEMLQDYLSTANPPPPNQLTRQNRRAMVIPQEKLDSLLSPEKENVKTRAETTPATPNKNVKLDKVDKQIKELKEIGPFKILAKPSNILAQHFLKYGVKSEFDPGKKDTILQFVQRFDKFVQSIADDYKNGKIEEKTYKLYIEAGRESEKSSKLPPDQKSIIDNFANQVKLAKSTPGFQK